MGCYLPEDPQRSYRGAMWIPAANPTPADDWRHVAVHEYGHHVDNQLLNFADVLPGLRCDFSSDGSRNWFFEREVEDNVLSGASCDPEAGWEMLLGEIYAEDFTWLNGNTAWRPDMPVPAPTEVQLGAMLYDFDSPLPDTRTIRRTRTVRHRWRIVNVSTQNWHFITVGMTGTRRADLDLYIYKRGGRRPLERSSRRGSRERIWTVLPPGRYEVAVYAYRQTGRGKVKIVLE